MARVVWLGAIIIGLALGLLGAGGSILTVPVLHYLVGQSPKEAIAHSLAIVALVSLAGALPYVSRREIDWRTVLVFGAAGGAGAAAGATVSALASGVVLLRTFGVLTLILAVAMWRHEKPAEDRPRSGTAVLLALGGAVGLLTGFLGAGGGMFILAVLVLYGGVPMRRAIGTTLVIIGINASTGFARQAVALPDVDPEVIGLMGAVGALGSMGGGVVAGRLSQRVLRRGFAIVLVSVGVTMLA